MSKSLPPNPSLENLRNQAKKLLKRCHDQDSAALARVAANLDGYFRDLAKFSRKVKLSDCQLVLAREYGFESWVEMKRAVELENADLIDQWLRISTVSYGDSYLTDIDRANELLHEYPNLASHNIWTAACASNAASIAVFLERDPGLANQKGGPLQFEPLLYLCYSRVFNDESDSLQAAKVLLENGADPNACFLTHGTYRFTCVTGAIGEGENGPKMCPPHPRAFELVTLLLENGAHPNDGQGLYNSMFTGGTHWLELLFKFGLKQGDPINWSEKDGHTIVDYLLAHAAQKNMVDRVELLLQHGADPNCIDCYQKRPCYELALKAGNTKVTALLEKHGAKPIVPRSPKEQFYSACMSVNQFEVGRLREKHGERKTDRWIQANREAISNATSVQSLRKVEYLQELGFPIGDALFEAAWNGSLEIAQNLVDNGAIVRRRHVVHGVTPIAFADRAGHSGIADFLLQQDIDIFDAVRFGDAKLVEKVLSREPASLEALYKQYGGTGDWLLHSPLIHAVVLGRTDNAEVLLAHGAKSNIKLHGKTLEELAIEKNHDDILNLLRRQ